MVIVSPIAAGKHCLLARRAITQAFPAPGSCNFLKAHNSGICNLECQSACICTHLDARGSYELDNSKHNSATPFSCSCCSLESWSYCSRSSSGIANSPRLQKARLFTSKIYSATSKKNKQIEENKVLCHNVMSICKASTSCFQMFSETARYR